MKILYGGCGVEGCLDCLPLFVVEDDGMQHEITITMKEHPNQPGIRSLWTVVLRADGGTYRRLIVSAENEDGAMDAACTIELAPLRSVVSVKPYKESE